MIVAGLVATAVGISVGRSSRSDGPTGDAPASITSQIAPTTPLPSDPSFETGTGLSNFPTSSDASAAATPVVVRRAVAVAMSAAQDASRPLPPTAVRLGRSPYLAAMPDGRLVISDPESRRVYAVSSDNTEVSTVAGDARDGASPTAILQDPGPVAVDSFGGIIIADQPAIGQPGRILRIDPTGRSAQLAEVESRIDHLYTDDQGSTFAQFQAPAAGASSTSASISTGASILRIGAAGDIMENTLPAGTAQLVAVSDSRWFRVAVAPPALISVSLFGSSTEAMTDITLTGALQLPTSTTGADGNPSSGAPVATVVPLGSSGFVSVLCQVSADLCLVRVHDGTGVTVATTSTSRVSSLVGRAGGFDIAVADGRVFRFDDPLLLKQSRVLLGATELLDADVALVGPPADAHLEPVALTVAPDGTVYWVDVYPSVSLGVLRTDGRAERLVLPAAITQPQQLTASREGLVLLSQGLVHMLPYDTLRIGQVTARDQAAISETRPAGDPVVGSIVALAPTPNGWLAIDSNEARRMTSSGSISLAAADEAGFVAYVDGRRLLGFDRQTGKSAEIATTVNAADDASAATFGLPESEIGTVGGIVALGKRSFVVSDPANDRLTLVAQTASGTWQVSRFLGSQPTTVTASPLSQRTVRPRLMASVTDGSIVFATDGGAINRMGADGTVRTIAGGAPLVTTPFGRIGGVAVTSTPAAASASASTSEDRLIVVADAARHRVVRLNRDGTQTIIAGTGAAGAGPNELDSPTAVATGAGLTVIADSANHRVVAVDSNGRRRTVAGTGIIGTGIAQGNATSVALNNPSGVAVASDGRIAVADTDNNRVLLVSTDGQMSALASIDHPKGVVFQGANHLLVSASTDGQVYRVQLDTKARSVVAGVGIRGYLGDGGPATAARLQDPNGISIGPDGAIYVSDGGNGAIRKISADGRIDTLVGGDGVFTNPSGIIIDAKLGLIFGEVDGRLFSVSTAELNTAVPNWSKPVN